MNLPGSGSPKPGGGCAESGPGVLPEPGDLTSSFIAPPYESEELGGLCKKEHERLKFRFRNSLISSSIRVTFKNMKLEKKSGDFNECDK